jgi:hypothetical protein
MLKQLEWYTRYCTQAHFLVSSISDVSGPPHDGFRIPYRASARHNPALRNQEHERNQAGD